MKRLFLFFLFLSYPLYAKDFTVHDLIESALSNNLDLKLNMAMSHAMKKDIDVQSGWSDTILMYSLKNISPGDSVSLQHMISLQQMIPLWGKTGFKAQAAQMDYGKSLANQVSVQRMVKMKLLSLGADYAAAVQQLAVYRDELKLFERLGGIVKTDYSTGKGLLATVVDVEIRIATINNKIVELTNMLTFIRSRILDIADIPLSDFNFITPALDLSNIPPISMSPASLFEYALSNNPAYQSAGYDIKKTEALGSLAAAEVFPDLGVGVSYMYTPSMPDHMFSLDFMINLPLFSAPKKGAMIGMAGDKKNDALLMQQSVADEIARSITQTLLNIDTLTAQAKILNEQILKLSENNIANMLSAYQVQKAGFKELLDSVLMYYNMRLEYIMTVRMLADKYFILELVSGKEFVSFN
ncbi:MAG: TolC family protein [Brevinematales bacterium]|nr:TolC family protein [Brevinematales bacterium]